MKVEKMVPEVYYKESRDFSFMGRLYEVLLNYMKTNAELVGNNLQSENINNLLVDLLSTTLGFQSKHKYITKDLIYITSAFSELIKKKGSKEAAEEIIRILLTSQKLNLKATVEYGEKEGNIDYTSLIICIPREMQDIVLFEDLLDYILPAGMITTIQPETTEEYTYSSTTNTSDSYAYVNANDSQIGKVGSNESQFNFSYNISEVGDNSANYSRALVGLGTVMGDYPSRQNTVTIEDLKKEQ